MIVVDAGVILALVFPLPYSGKAAFRLRALKEAQEELYAPSLLEYEVCSALRRAVAQRLLHQDAAAVSVGLIQTLGIRTITPASSLHELALSWASRLRHSKAYDAQYLALAEQMDCHLLTADARLARSAQAAGAKWIESLV